MRSVVAAMQAASSSSTENPLQLVDRAHGRASGQVQSTMLQQGNAPAPAASRSPLHMRLPAQLLACGRQPTW